MYGSFDGRSGSGEDMAARRGSYEQLEQVDTDGRSLSWLKDIFRTPLLVLVSVILNEG